MWGTGDWSEMLWGGMSAVPGMSPRGLLILAALLVGLGVVMQRRHAPQWAMWTLGVAVVLIPLAAYAGSISIPNTFINGTVADADEVNANFSAVKTAVDDNDSRTSVLETQAAALEADKQERINGSCVPGSSIRAIDGTGAVTCEIDDVGVDTNAATLCGPGEFLDGDGNCVAAAHVHDASDIASGTLSTDRYDAYADLELAGRLDDNQSDDLLTRLQLDSRYVSSTGGAVNGTLTANSFAYSSRGVTRHFSISALTLISPDLVRHAGFGEAYVATAAPDNVWSEAPVHLPDGASVQSMTCVYKDNTTDGRMFFDLKRHAQQAEASLASISTTLAFADPNTVTTTSAPATFEVVDNANYAYYLLAYFQTSGVAKNTSNLSLNRCLITYTVATPLP